MSTYYVEHAKSGRGKCRRFKTAIPKGELKIGVEVNMDEDTSWKQWFSLEGFKDKMIAARTQTIESADMMIGYDTCSSSEKDTLRKLVASISDIRSDSKLKAEYKKSVAHLKPKKKSQKKRPKPEQSSASVLESVQDVVKGAPKIAMASLLSACRVHDVPLPQSDDDAKQRLRGYLLHASPQGRASNIWNIREAFRAVCEELAAEKLSGKSKKAKITVEAAVKANQKLVDAFLEMSSGLFATNKFKAISYKKVANAIAELDFEVTDGMMIAKGKRKVAGVGKSAGTAINDILSTGTCATLEEVRAG